MSSPNPDTPPIPEKLRQWLNRAVETGASDLHLVVGYRPVLRLHGDLTELPGPPLGSNPLLPIGIAGLSPGSETRRTSISLSNCP